MVVGISGKSNTGKNYVASYFERQGFIVLDADKVGYEALIAKQDEIVTIFGHCILSVDGQIDRVKLGQIVFSNPKKLAQLNAISHSYICTTINSFINKNLKQNIAINAALLPYWDITGLQAVVWTSACFFLRLGRAIQRDRRGLVFTIKRIWAQRTLNFKIFNNRVDIYRVANNGTLASFNKKLDNVLVKLQANNKNKEEIVL
jgi:dephospho-CoA kinase